MEKILREKIKHLMIEKKTNSSKEIELRYQTLKNILETAQKLAKNDLSEITDKYIIDAAKKEVKQANDMLSTKGPDGKIIDLPENVKSDMQMIIAVASEMLPAMVSEDEIFAYLTKENIEKNMGACMKALKSHFGDSLDGKSASTVVRSYIQ